jgi:hypothetical protein
MNPDNPAYGLISQWAISLYKYRTLQIKMAGQARHFQCNLKAFPAKMRSSYASDNA